MKKKCKGLKSLDFHGAESAKIDATQASVRKLLTKINVCIRAVDTISSRMHKLRDGKLLPQVTELINGNVRFDDGAEAEDAKQDFQESGIFLKHHKIFCSFFCYFNVLRFLQLE